MNAATRKRDTEFQTVAVCEKKHAFTVWKLRGACGTFIAVLAVFATLTLAVYSQCRDILEAAERAQRTATVTAERAAEKAAHNGTAIKVIESTLPRIEKGVDEIRTKQDATQALLVKIAAHRDKGQ